MSFWYSFLEPHITNYIPLNYRCLIKMSNWIRDTSALDSLMILSNLALPYLVPLVFSNLITFTDNFLNIQVHLGKHVILSIMDQSSVAACVSKKCSPAQTHLSSNKSVLVSCNSIQMSAYFCIPYLILSKL